MLKNICLYALLSFVGRLIYTGASIGDSIVVLSLSAIYALQIYLNQQKEEPINDTLKVEIEQLKSSVNALRLGKSLVK